MSTGYVLGEKLSPLDTNGNLITAIPSISQSYITVGIQAGYFYHPFKNSTKMKGLFIEPNIGLTYAVGKDDLLLGSKIIAKKPLAIAPPRINIGWKIEL